MIFSTIQLRKARLPVAKLVFIIESSLLVLGLFWMVIRRLPILEDIKITLPAFILGIMMGLVILASSALFYLIDLVFFGLKLRNLVENTIYPIFARVTMPEIVMMAIMSGVCEEFFFRGVLLREFGIITACIIFGLLHTSSKDTWFMGVWSALAGAFFAILYIKTGNLFVPMVAHAINNFIGVTYIRYIYTPAKEKAKKEEKIRKAEKLKDSTIVEEGDKLDEMGICLPNSSEKPAAPLKPEEDFRKDESIPAEVNPVKDADICPSGDFAVEQDVHPQTHFEKDAKPLPTDNVPELVEDQAIKVSSPVQLLDPSMLEGKLPTDTTQSQIPPYAEKTDFELLPSAKEANAALQQITEKSQPQIPVSTNATESQALAKSTKTTETMEQSEKIEKADLTETKERKTPISTAEHDSALEKKKGSEKNTSSIDNWAEKANNIEI